MALTLPDDQQSTLSVAIVDKRGEPATPAATPSWTASDPNLLSLTASSDGLSCVVAVGGLSGVTLPATAQVTVQVEGDPTPGKDTIVGTLDVNLVGGEAATVTISAGPLSTAAPVSNAPASGAVASAPGSSAPSAGTVSPVPGTTASAAGAAIPAQ